jgi:phage shock protein A
VWRERAKKLAQSDEPKALECLRRSKRIEKQVLELEKQEREHAKMEKDLARDLSVVEERLVALRQQRNIMRTRQSRAEALRLLQQVDSRAVSDIDDIFGRWEAQVSACEVRAQLDHSTEDLLHEELSTQEEEIELRHLLAEMSDNSATKE